MFEAGIGVKTVVLAQNQPIQLPVGLARRNVTLVNGRSAPGVGRIKVLRQLTSNLQPLTSSLEPTLAFARPAKAETETHNLRLGTLGSNCDVMEATTEVPCDA
jgi:hypothetical protein